MNRRSFIKSILALSVFPTALIGTSKVVKPAGVGSMAGLGFMPVKNEGELFDHSIGIALESVHKGDLVRVSLGGKLS